MSNASQIAGRRVLVIEDETLISMLIEDTLVDAGCEVVGTASHLEEALDKARTLSFDVAIVDINLNGQNSFPVTEALRARGRPFVISTGYGSGNLPASLRDVPLLQKPFELTDIVQALSNAMPGSGPAV